MDARLPAVVEHFGIRAAALFERVAEDRHAVKGALIVDRLRQAEWRSARRDRASRGGRGCQIRHG